MKTHIVVLATRHRIYVMMIVNHVHANYIWRKLLNKPLKFLTKDTVLFFTT